MSLKKIVLLCLFAGTILFLTTACQKQKATHPLLDDGFDQQTSSNYDALQTTSEDFEEWLIPLLGQYLQDDNDTVAGLKVSFSASSVNESAGSITMNVSRTGDLSNAISVALSSSDSSELSVPSTLNFASGQNSVSTQVTVIDDCLADGNQSVTVTASANGYLNGIGGLEVVDNFTSSGTLNLSLSFGTNSIIESAGTVPVTVSHNGPTCAAVSVNLSSNNTSELSVPATVTIPANISQAVFNATVVNDVFTDGNKLVEVSANATNYTGVEGNITVVDDDIADGTATQVGIHNGHLSIIAPTDTFSEDIVLFTFDGTGGTYLLIEDSSGKPLQILTTGISSGGATNKVILLANTISGISVDTKPTASTLDSVQINNNWTLSKGLDISSGFINLANNITINAGSENIRIWARKNVNQGGSSLETTSGDITMYANVDTKNTSSLSDDSCLGTAGTFSGIYTSGGDIETTTGDIKLSSCGGNGGNGNNGMVVGTNTKVSSTSGSIGLNGLGGSSAGHNNVGVLVFQGGKVESDGSSPITVVGKGGSGTKENFGVQVFGNGTLGATAVTTKDGQLTVTGFGGSDSTGVSNIGVQVQESGEIKSIGSGDVVVNGTGAQGTCPSTSTFCSYHGIAILYNAQIGSFGTGKLNITGQGGTANGRENHGILIDVVKAIGGTSAKIFSANGDITVIANGGVDTTNTQVGGSGIYLIYGGSIEAQNNANISVTGQGGPGERETHGIFFEGDGTVNGGQKSKITSVNGNITLTGTGSATGVSGDTSGIDIITGEVKSTGTGSIVMNGIGGKGLATAHGIQLNFRTEVSTVSGSINLTGIANQGTGNGNNGVNIVNESIVKTDSGSVMISGQASSIGQGGNTGVSIRNTAYDPISTSPTTLGFAASRIQSNTGTITISGVGGGNGIGGGTGDGNMGVQLGNFSQYIRHDDIDKIVTGGGEIISNIGTVSVEGIAGKGINNNAGVFMTTTPVGPISKISSNGIVNVIGKGSPTSSGAIWNRAIEIVNGASVVQNGVTGSVNYSNSGFDGNIVF